MIMSLSVPLYDRHFGCLDHPLAETVKKIIAISDYAGRHIEVLNALLAEDDCQYSLSLDDYIQQVNQLVDTSEAHFMRHLRLFRHRHFIRLLLREQSGLASTQDTLRDWSYCAEAIILRAIAFAQMQLQGRFGRACESSGATAILYTLGMGKLGGYELNFSSDIDLIFAYSAAGYTNGNQVVDNQQYFVKVVQSVIHLLQSITADGFVFRVDLRLRPNGDSGALVSSLAAMENYYQEQGRDWERYAMVKARMLGVSHDWFERLMIPFVYRRYVDFSVIESLRSMKSMIEREVQLNPQLDDIKRGMGGIREIEFIVQNIQLIRGGRLPQLRQPAILKVMTTLKQEALLPRANALKKAYLFLRKLENYLQAHNDQQTHSLPENTRTQMQITLAMGFADWQSLLLQLNQYQRIVSTIFRKILAKPDDYGDSNRLLLNQLASLWQGHVETGMAVHLLASLGYKNAERCYHLIYAFRHAPRCRRLSQASRLRLDRFMPILLKEMATVPDTETVLLQVMRLLDNIVGRSAYLALLTESPSALQELLYWFANSPLISNWLVEYPFLLEQLLKNQNTWRMPGKQQLIKQLTAQLALCTDSEAREELLRQFRLSYTFQIARAEMLHQIDAVRAGKFLADLAEVIVLQVFELACQQIMERSPEQKAIKNKFAVIAYGKLGSREMNYNSDLDLVFIHDASPNETTLITRLTQKIIHMLTARSQAGILYQVDTRLRPSGSSGLLVASLQSFLDYQQKSAWTWEHQALIRARMLVGNATIRQAFTAMKAQVLGRVRDLKQTTDEVRSMRSKINLHLEKDQIKHMPGGLLDLEFLVQGLILVHPHKEFSRYTHTLNLLQRLTHEKIINASQHAVLKKAYQRYHFLLHQHLLKNIVENDVPEANIVREIYEYFIK